MKPARRRVCGRYAPLLAATMPLAAGAVQSAEPIAVHGVPIAGPSETRLLQPAQFEGDPLLLMLPDSLNLIRGQQKLEANRDALEHNPETPVAGNPEGDVTVVEFFDYRCPYCRRFAERLETMFEADPGVRFVFKDWPMFGGASVTAARAALAAARQGQYLAMHEALMATRLLTEDVIVMKAEELGLDTKRLQADMASQDIDRQLAATALQAEELGLRGTPAFVIGRRVLPGLPTDEALAAAIAAVRADR